MLITDLHPQAGRATGRARVVLDPSDPTALEPGDVLVAPITDPAWTPLFVPAAAVVVDVGAQISHAVIVSRELGIPAIVGTDSRAGAFTRDFRPLHSFSRDRLRSLAEALNAMRSTQAATRGHLMALARGAELSGADGFLADASSYADHYDQHHGWIRDLVGR